MKQLLSKRNVIHADSENRLECLTQKSLIIFDQYHTKLFKWNVVRLCIQCNRRRRQVGGYYWNGSLKYGGRCEWIHVTWDGDCWWALKMQGFSWPSVCFSRRTLLCGRGYCWFLYQILFRICVKSTIFISIYLMVAVPNHHVI